MDKTLIEQATERVKHAAKTIAECRKGSGFDLEDCARLYVAASTLMSAAGYLYEQIYLHSKAMGLVDRHSSMLEPNDNS